MISLVILLAVSAFLVMAASTVEVAVFGVPQLRLKELVSVAARGSRSLAALRKRSVNLQVAVWVVRATGVAVAVLAFWGPFNAAFRTKPFAALLSIVLAVLLAVLTQSASKVLVQPISERFALAVAAPVWLLTRVLSVLTWPVEAMIRVLSPQFGEVLPGLSDREIRALVSPGRTDTVIDEHELHLIRRAFELDQTTAYDIMTPRVDMFAWPENKTLAEIASELRSVRYSRVPIYSGSVDKVTGVLHTRDAYQALVSGQRDVPLKALAREPFFVPGSVTLDRLLLDFQARRIHMGIVIDEYGGVDGLVALEDILEELVGEIIDESDVAEEPIIRLSRSEILVDGSADLREINHFFNTTFPLLEHRSLNGYLLDVLGRVPSPGEKLVAEGVLIEVTAATETQVLRARLGKPGSRGAAREESAAEAGGTAPEGEPGKSTGADEASSAEDSVRSPG